METDQVIHILSEEATTRHCPYSDMLGREYEKLVKEQQKLRKLEVNMNGRKKVVDVMSLEVRTIR